MKRMLERLRTWLSARWKRLKQRARILWKAIKGRIERDRTSRTRYAYVALSVGTVVLAYLLVLLNLGVFSLMERGLYNRETYEPVSIISAGNITDPLSRAVRVALYHDSEIEGEERSVLPEERSRAVVLEQIQSLWEQTLSYYAADGYLKTGESLDRVLAGSKYTARLRDFYNEKTGTKLALWNVQAYYTAVGGRVFCLSAEVDSRTADVYSMTLALFENIDGSDPVTDFYPMLDTLGEPRTAAEHAIVTSVENGSETTITLSDGNRLVRITEPGVQLYLRLE